ncbi:HD-GYP domain-containing protein [Candidatus Bipolaricaulota bacterium]
MIEGLTIKHRGESVDRVEKRATTLELLAKNGSIEVSRQQIEAGRHFYLYAKDEWSGFELVYVLGGVLTVDRDPAENENGDPVTLHSGDYLYHNGLPEKVFFRAEESVELLLFSSAPSFNLARDGVEDMAAMARSVEEKDSMTEGHCDRLGRQAVRTAERLGLSGQVLIDISYGAYLHDLGKVQVPSEILGKAGLLTDEEWEEMKRHPDLGAEMLCEKDFLGGAAEIVRAHHERFDGSGYPRGLKGEDIPIGARIISVADTYDAITSVRPYQAAQVKDDAIKELRSGAGTQFDPRVVDAFIEIIGTDDAE